ncbi:hypothetical protein chiPu_0025047, partial [Chiloscyllium punctatum]|nr:hypothetical protein [Chiloscyllium punctatum]
CPSACRPQGGGAGRRSPRSAAASVAAASVPPGWGPSLSPGRQPPPYYELEPEDLACYALLHPPESPSPGQAPVHTTNCRPLDLPEDDVEFWSRFYFASAESAWELVRQRQLPLPQWE